MPRGIYRRITGGKMRGDFHIPRGLEVDGDGYIQKKNRKLMEDFQEELEKQRSRKVARKLARKKKSNQHH